MDYWRECVAESFEDAGLVATDDQIDTVTSWVEGAHENYGLATGSDFIPDPRDSEIEKLKKVHAEEISDWERRDLNYRKSVAARYGIEVCDVYQDRDGSVRYRP